MTYRKKLIEVALPLDAINSASIREKSMRHGHPFSLHLWWARRPLAACRAVIFASLVDDPSAHPERFPSMESQEVARQKLFRIIEQLVLWENSNNRAILDAAKSAIEESTNGAPPALLDPFCGGGSIPLEAQRLGLESYASDLNPIAVLITKALIEIPPKFANQPPVNPRIRSSIDGENDWPGARGLAEDVRYYGQWMRDEAYKLIGQLYPKVTLDKEKGSGEATVIAWLWARTVICSNPACRAWMPLVRSFWLSTLRGTKAWIVPRVDYSAKAVSFEVHTGAGSPPSGTVKNRSAICLFCNSVSTLTYIRAEAQAGRMKEVPLAIIAEGQRGRLYLSPSEQHEVIARSARPTWEPEEAVTAPSHDVDRLPMYGMFKWGDAFTDRQLVTLTTFTDLVGKVREQIRKDSIAAGILGEGMDLSEQETAIAYADAIATYLAFLVDQLSNHQSTMCSWHSRNSQMRTVFSRQAISMTWDYAESNVFCNSSGSFANLHDRLVKGLALLPARGSGEAQQRDATSFITSGLNPIISTDPPYYDNITYADVSDFFYVWLRRSLSKIYPELFGTLLVPKAQELVAASHRFDGSREKAQQFFEKGLAKAFAQMRQAQNQDFPLTVYYAFKQTEADENSDDSPRAQLSGVASTGWETMLEALLSTGFSISGTWPIRTEMDARMVGHGTNALASSIVLVCRPRPVDAPLATRREFLNALKHELPNALHVLQHGSIAPVDLAQATIGPGMAVFSRYSRVMEADGSPMRVRTALQLINAALDEVLTEQEGEFDADTRWALAWFEQFGTGEGLYGVAETLSKAKNTSITGLAEAGVLVARGGKVRLLGRDELPDDWDPAADTRLTVWEATQHLIRSLEQHGEQGAAAMLAQLRDRGEVARDLAYRLYTVCERKGWADEALAYNGLVIAWPQITQLASQQAAEMPRQQEMFT